MARVELLRAQGRALQEAVSDLECMLENVVHIRGLAASRAAATVAQAEVLIYTLIDQLAESKSVRFVSDDEQEAEAPGRQAKTARPRRAA